MTQEPTNPSGWDEYQLLKLSTRAYWRDNKRRIIEKNRTPCVVCAHPLTEGHHYDYNYPLRVWWLCRRHHSLQHVGRNSRAFLGQFEMRKDCDISMVAPKPSI